MTNAQYKTDNQSMKFHKVELLLTEHEMSILQTLMTDDFKRLVMNQHTKGDQVALQVVTQISHAVGQVRGFLGNPKRKAEAEERQAAYANQ